MSSNLGAGLGAAATCTGAEDSGPVAGGNMDCEDDTGGPEEIPDDDADYDSYENYNSYYHHNNNYYY